MAVAIHHEVGSGQKSLTSPIGVRTEGGVLEQSNTIAVTDHHPESMRSRQLPRVDDEVRAIRSRAAPQVVPYRSTFMRVRVFRQRVQLSISVSPEE